jgi:hypothetical protein
MLTRKDVDDFGPELLDVAQRAAQHAVGPELQRLHDENEMLRDEVSRAAKLAIDQHLDAAVPNWREINADPRWLGWLAQIDTFNGCTRQSLLNRAVAAGNAARVTLFFKNFLAEAGSADAANTAGQPRPRQGRSAPSGKPIYSRGQILQMASMRRRGQIGDAEWAKWEYELCLASREGRVAGALGIDGVPVTR